MEYITSRGFKLPRTSADMETADWFNMWKRRNFPYLELLAGDVVYWYESKTQQILWKTEIKSVERDRYASKKDVVAKYNNDFGGEYYESRPDQGFYIGYKVRVIERIKVPKPSGFLMPQLGWLRVSSDIASRWFSNYELEENTTLDENVRSSNISVQDQLVELNEIMKGVSPERIEKTVQATIRKDTKMIRALKKAWGYKCQFPDCASKIEVRTGGLYVEVAHIKPVKVGGQSILGNLVVMCPNHHKEFDHGDLVIEKQSLKRLRGRLNRRNFDIDLSLN